MLETLDRNDPPNSDNGRRGQARRGKHHVLFLDQPNGWNRTRGGMNANIGNIFQPAQYSYVRRHDIEPKAVGLQPCCQRNQEASFQVSVEALDLA